MASYLSFIFLINGSIRLIPTFSPPNPCYLKNKNPSTQTLAWGGPATTTHSRILKK